MLFVLNGGNFLGRQEQWRFALTHYLDVYAGQSDSYGRGLCIHLTISPWILCDLTFQISLTCGTSSKAWLKSNVYCPGLINVHRYHFKKLVNLVRQHFPYT